MSAIQQTTGSPQFADLHKVEHDEIQKRRRLHGRPPIDLDIPPDSEKAQETGFAVYNTPGLSLSGGGIRSAAFCLGALQSISETIDFKNIDYLSTVSGGGYIGASLTTTYAKAHKFVFGSSKDFSDQPAVGHIRNYSNYLFPRGERGAMLKSVAVVLRGLSANIALTLTVALAYATSMVWAYPDSASLTNGSFILRLFHHATKPMAATVTIALGVFVLMLAWGIWRSFSVSRGSDVKGPMVSIGAFLLALLAIVAFLDIQPILISAMFKPLHSGGFEKFLTWLKSVVAYLTPFAGVATFFANALSKVAAECQRTKGPRAIVVGLASKAAIVLAALVLPLALWVAVLHLCAAGIADSVTKGYPLAYHLLEGHPDLRDAIKSDVPRAYLIAFLVMSAITFWFSPNANSLHRLYRDRLSKAFLFHPSPNDDGTEGAMLPDDGFKLSDMSPPEGGPYHLINAALNIEASKIANGLGRNADYFLFSRKFVGSDTTEYVPTAKAEAAEPRLDLATAVATSGAAFSSDMGSNSIAILAPTLALLNMRLGYWMKNPRRMAGKSKWSWKIGNKFYLALEMFGLLDETSGQVYLTDGGHIENLGLYQLLKRGCRVIIAVDAEQDATMEFPAFIKLQRYARIDLGIRIDLAWQSIAASSHAATVAAENGLPFPPEKGPHCALGVIHYPNGVDGYLLYLKSSLSGDENDYILDYKRRNPAFPHESTGDQFFTEEQFEVYRALGFHVGNDFFCNAPADSVSKFLAAL